MPIPILINLVVEDSLSEAVVRRTLAEFGGIYEVGVCYGNSGSGYIRKRLPGFNHAARVTPYLVLTDLDALTCPPALLHKWIRTPLHPNLIFRVAVREVESWLLAHAEGMAGFLGIRRSLIPDDPESVADPKRLLIGLASQSMRRQLRESLVPRRGSTAVVGPDYNGPLIQFVRTQWDVKAAASRSESLARFLDAMKAFALRVPSRQQARSRP